MKLRTVSHYICQWNDIDKFMNKNEKMHYSLVYKKQLCLARSESNLTMIIIISWHIIYIFSLILRCSYPEFEVWIEISFLRFHWFLVCTHGKALFEMYIKCVQNTYKLVWMLDDEKNTQIMVHSIWFILSMNMIFMFKKLISIDQVRQYRT